MAAAVKIRTGHSSPAVGEVAFSRGKLEGDGWFSCVVSVEADGEISEIKLGMIEPYRADMLGFFEDLGRASGDWEGELFWESEFAEVRIEARFQAGADVLFDVLVRWPPTYEEERQTALAFPRDAVGRAAERMHDFLRLERGSRFNAHPDSRQWSPRPT